jgi:hypothetical protein
MMSIKRYTTILMGSLLMISCQNKNTSKLNQPPAKDSTERRDSMVAVTQTEAKRYIMDFPEFWRKFRTAVLKYDTTQIIEMTVFPFHTRGELDSDPDVEYNNKEFSVVFNYYLKQFSGQLAGTEETSEFEEIKKMDTIKRTVVNNGYARIGDLVFNKTS